jgi:hypothetical protein
VVLTRMPSGVEGEEPEVPPYSVLQCRVTLFRMVLNNSAGQTASGGGTPRAENYVFKFNRSVTDSLQATDVRRRCGTNVGVVAVVSNPPIAVGEPSRNLARVVRRRWLAISETAH